MKAFFSYVFLFLAIFSNSETFAITLTDPETGLTVQAPKGYKLSSKNGVYTLKGKNSTARFMMARSPYNLGKTVDSYIKLAKIRNARRTKRGSTEEVSGTLGARSVIVNFKASGGIVDIVTYSSNPRPSRRVAAARTSAAVTIPDILNLQRIVRSRRGGRSVPLNLTIPMRSFVAPDGGSSALVPNLPGWSFAGGGGVITAVHPRQGIASLGVPVAVSVPGFFGSPPISQFVRPDVAIAQVWPQYAQVYANAQVQVLSVSFIPGTEGWLGGNGLSAMFAVRFLLNGAPWQAMFVSGSFLVPDLSIGWYWYHSYIAVPENGPGGIGAALMDTWASWDNSGAAEARLRSALRTVLTTRVDGYPIDPDVFEKTNNAWSEYIRQ